MRSDLSRRYRSGSTTLAPHQSVQMPPKWALARWGRVSHGAESRTRRCSLLGPKGSRPHCSLQPDCPAGSKPHRCTLRNRDPKNPHRPTDAAGVAGSAVSIQFSICILNVGARQAQPCGSRTCSAEAAGVLRDRLQRVGSVPNGSPSSDPPSPPPVDTEAARFLPPDRGGVIMPSWS